MNQKISNQQRRNEMEDIFRFVAEDIFSVQGLVLASITAVCCGSAFIAGTRKRKAEEAEKARQITAGNGE
jgi:hypothetical protein